MIIHPKHKKQSDKWIDSGLKGNLYLEDIENLPDDGQEYPVPVVRILGKNEELLNE